MNWAILLNTRTSNSNDLISDVDDLVWNVIPTITTWPTGDQFTSIDEEELKLSVFVSPNPSNGKITISSIKSIESIEIYNLSGEKIYVNSEIGNLNKLNVDISSQPSGIYLVRAKSSGNYFSKKFIIQ